MIAVNRHVRMVSVGDYFFGKVGSERVDPNIGTEMSSHYRDVMRKAFEEYMRSPEWESVRRKVIARDRGKCCGCGFPGRIVHHTCYRNWGKGNIEEVMDCLLLCSECHDKEHIHGKVAVPFFAKQEYRAMYREGGVYGTRLPS